MFPMICGSDVETNNTTTDNAASAIEIPQINFNFPHEMPICSTVPAFFSEAEAQHMQSHPG